MVLASVAPAVSFVLGVWTRGGPSACDCHCNFSGLPAADARLIELLQRQLDRCGPANLTCAPCP
eukprot:7590616-Heterocapsa_arctica.AAC.1